MEPTRRDSLSSESDTDSVLSDLPPVDIYVEEAELSDDQDATITDPDQSLSEEQTYREIMREIRSYMGWTHILDIHSSATTSSVRSRARFREFVHTLGRVVAKPTHQRVCAVATRRNTQN